MELAVQIFRRWFRSPVTSNQTAFVLRDLDEHIYLDFQTEDVQMVATFAAAHKLKTFIPYDGRIFIQLKAVGRVDDKGNVATRDPFRKEVGQRKWDAMLQSACLLLDGFSFDEQTDWEAITQFAGSRKLRFMWIANSTVSSLRSADSWGKLPWHMHRCVADYVEMRQSQADINFYGCVIDVLVASGGQPLLSTSEATRIRLLIADPTMTLVNLRLDIVVLHEIPEKPVHLYDCSFQHTLRSTGRLRDRDFLSKHPEIDRVYDRALNTYKFLRENPQLAGQRRTLDLYVHDLESLRGPFRSRWLKRTLFLTTQAYNDWIVPAILSVLLYGSLFAAMSLSPDASLRPSDILLFFLPPFSLIRTFLLDSVSLASSWRDIDMVRIAVAVILPILLFYIFAFGVAVKRRLGFPRTDDS